MNIYQFKDLIFVQGDTRSGYLRPFEVKTMRMRGAGSAAPYEKYKHAWKLIGELDKTHRIIEDVSGKKLVPIHSGKTTNRSVSFSLSLLERLDNLAKEQERPFSWIVNKLILKGLGDDKN